MKTEVLSQNDIEIIKRDVLEILEKKGMVVHHQQALKALKKAGARVDEERSEVRFPNELVLKALELAPKDILWAARDPKWDIHLPARGTIFAGSGTGAPNIVDPLNGEYRRSNSQDLVRMVRLVDDLEWIDRCTFFSIDDAPVQTIDVHALHLALTNTCKNILIQPYSKESVEYLLELSSAAAGGKDALKARPIVHIMSCATTPLEYKEMDIEVMTLAGRYGVPLVIPSLTTAGATVPVTIAGALLVSAAEIVGGLTITQILSPGTPVVAGPVAYSMDMSSGYSMQSSAEAVLRSAASCYFFKNAYSLPTQTLGFGSDSFIPDAQATMDSSLRCLLVALGGGDILSNAGFIETLQCHSPLSLIVDNDIAGIVKRLVKGVEVNDEILGLPTTLALPHGGDYIAAEHTLRHCREAVRPKLVRSFSRDVWTSQGSPDIMRRAREQYQNILDTHKGIPLPETNAREMESIVREADRTLVN